MPAQLHCGQCGKSLEAGDAVPGTRILCPGCGAFSTVPAPASGGPIEFRCTGCDRLLRTPADTAGKQARCPECGAVVSVPQPGAGVLDDTLPYPTPPAQQGEEKGSPFAPAGAPPAGGHDAENPYAAPTQYGPAPTGPFGVSGPTAASRVAGPAIALIVVGALGVAFQALNLVAGVFHMGWGMGQGGPNAFPLAIPFGVVIAQHSVCLLMGFVIILGAVRMKNLQSYSFAMTSAILAMLPCISPCCVLGLPFGIWALVVLSDAAVKAAFRS